MAQSYIEMARLATSPHTESHQNTIRDFVLQHNTLLFAPGGMCSRVLELEHQLSALSARIAALENAQPAEGREPDERFKPDVVGQASTPVLSFPFSVNEVFEPASQETTPHNSKELVRPLKRKRNRSSAPGPKHRLPAFPVIQVTFDENAQSSREVLSFSSTPDLNTQPSRPPRNRPLNKVSASSSAKRSGKRRSINRQGAQSTSESKNEADGPGMTELICCDRCSQWFHVGCTDVPPDDPRLTSPELPFFCERCASGSGSDTLIEPVDKNACGRSGCTRPIEPGSDEYVIERIIGKRSMSTDGGNLVEYLIKWEGYSAPEADWRAGDDLGSLFRVLCSDFERRAADEGLPSTEPKVLLKEATDAGWT